MDFFIVYGLTFIALIITLSAQTFVTSTYSKYIKIANKNRLTGAEAARKLLDKNGLKNIYVVETGGYLTDHYDPSRKVIRLSKEVYGTPSIAAVAVACHECGHAIQDKEGYSFMRIRAALVPFVNFSSYAGYFAILFGIISGILDLIRLGILAEVVILLFQIVTLPVEFDASKRALVALDNADYLSSGELVCAKKVLTAAALTYVASVTTTIIQILRLILMFGERDDQ